LTAPVAKPVDVKVETAKPLEPRAPSPSAAKLETPKPPEVRAPSPSTAKVETPKPPVAKLETPKPPMAKLETPKPPVAKLEVPAPAAKPIARKQTLLGLEAQKPETLKALEPSIDTLKAALSRPGLPKPPPARPEFVSVDDLDEGFDVDTGSEPPPEPVQVAPTKPAPPMPPSPPGKPARGQTLMLGSPVTKTDEPAPASIRAEAASEIKIDAASTAAANTKVGPLSERKTGGTLTNDTPTSDSVQRGKSATAIDKIGPASTLGRYEILTPIARGGMASVWAARLMGTRGFQKLVAVKTMLPDVSDDPDFEQMFLDEARVAARIRHPNVAEILDLGEQDDVLYLVMEWVEGENLSVVLKAARNLGGMPLPVILRIASQACAGLHAAHELRDDSGHLVDLIHRDVSPANVLVSMAGFVKLVDFGVAKSKGRMHVTRAGGMVKGKTPYLSPEQLGGLPLDRRSDIFSFGALLYVMATGLHPFRGETEGKTVENIALKNPVPLRTINAEIPVEFEKVVLKALEKDPKNRFSTAAELQRALDQIGLAIGGPATESDVAEFVRKAIGEPQAKRAADIKSAIASLDALTTGSGDIPRSDAFRFLDGGKRAPNSAKPDAEGESPRSSSAPSPMTSEEVTLDAPPGYDAFEVKPPVEKADEELAVDAFAAPISVPIPTSTDADPPLKLAVDEDTSAPSARSEEDDDAFAVRPRPKRLQIIVGAVVGACALVGILAAVFGGGGSTSTTHVETTQATSTATAVVPVIPTATATAAPEVPTAAVVTPPPPSAAVEVPPTAAPTAEPVAPPTPPPTTKTIPKGKVQGSSATPTKAPIKPTTKPPTTKKYNPTGI
ncbi:MAG: protein kinase, partial [Byssovorax sp.]